MAFHRVGKGLLMALPMAVLGFGGGAHAAGFAIQEYSVRDLGEANAGFAALAEDATTVFSNPAGMARLDGIHINAGGHVIFGTGSFDNTGSVDAAGRPLRGGTGGNFLNTALVPNVYATLSLSDRLRLGVGVSAPFGLKTEYDADWVGRYQATKSSLKIIDINPALAFRLSDMISLGAGLSVQYLDVELDNAIDFGAVCFGAVEPRAPGTCPALGLFPQAADGSTALKGTHWAVGFNAGILFELSPATRVGLQYRSKVKHDIKGRVNFVVPATVTPLLPALGGAFMDSAAAATLELPERASISLFQDLGDRLALMADFTWTGWSSFKELRVTFANPAQPTQIEEEHYKDSWRAALGGRYYLNDAVIVRAGGAFDKSPAVKEFRDARIPDNNRIVLAVGMSWRLSPALTVDAAYNHIFIKASAIDRLGPGGDRLSGEFHGNVNLLSAAVNLNF